MNLIFAKAQYINPSLIPDLEYETVWVGKILPRHGGKVMQKLSGKLGIETLQHLKRVRQIKEENNDEDNKTYLHIVLCPCNENDTDGEYQMPDVIRDIINELDVKLYEAQVPKHAPRNKEQREEYSKVWPVNYRPLDSSMLNNPEIISQEQQQEMEQYMRKCFKLQKDKANAALIVDPITSKCVAVGIDDEQHVLRHAIMCAIDNVANTHSGNKATSKISRERDSPTSVTEEQPQFKKSRVEYEDALPQKQHSIQGVQNQNKYNATENQNDQDQVDNQNNLSDVANITTCKQCNSLQCVCMDRVPYMCTGYHCYVIREPCVMCAMALVHSRVTRVVYCVKDNEFGALGGKFNLQEQKSLNHHYEVYWLERHK
eukprot:TRINITY_DN7538_c0_g1_i11.p1 TRINITY_DN7538_c0_g1~~TRINITY_DN7538_c0_g1_i11.p1  ORF type:complete len:372 (-),score=25.79 TRINITY_DN7538_c0_g1_i11:385-1500(-)